MKLKMIKDYEEGRIQPKEDDPFPNLSLMPDLEMCTGFFLKCNNLSLLGEGKASSKEMYMNVVLKHLIRRLYTRLVVK